MSCGWQHNGNRRSAHIAKQQAEPEAGPQLSQDSMVGIQPKIHETSWDCETLMLPGSRWSGWVGESVERTKPSMALVREVPDGPCIWSWVWRYVVPGHARVLWPSTSRKLMFNTVFSFFVHDSLLGAARAWSLNFFPQLAQHVAPQVCSLLSPWFWALVFFFVGWSSVFWLPLSIWRACKQIQQRILRFHFQRFFSCEALIKVVAAKVFVETHKSDLGGHFWRVQMQHTQLGLVIYIVVSNLLPSLPCWRIVGLEFGVSFFFSFKQFFQWKFGGDDPDPHWSRRVEIVMTWEVPKFVHWFQNNLGQIK